MEEIMSWFLLRLLLLLSSGIGIIAHGGSVTYDRRSLVINGKHRILFSGSIHYPRSTPEMWPSLIAKAKAGGLEVIDTYVFWNLHEPRPGEFDFSGRRDIVRFLKEVHAQGLYVCLRLGPFIESEWTYGGLPFWLHDVPGIVYRSDNKPFKYHMERYARTIVGMLKAEKLYASQGGPIILSQIENEYKNVEAAFHEKGPSYVTWAAKMAVGLQTGVPWVMCKQDDAPDPVINACNGLRCGETFAGPNSPNKPAIWTEDWTTVFEAYGRKSRMRSAEDIAFHVALFIAKGGSFVNYYMYHGGTNFGRTGSEYVPTRYYDQAPLDEYGMFRQPKWGHLKELHAAIKLCVKPLLSATRKNLSLGQQQEAFVFERRSGECAAFLINNDRRSNTMVNFKNSSYKLPPTSISILPDCKTIAFNTAQVNAQYGTRSANTRQKFDSIEQWEEYKEAIPSFDETSLRLNMLLDQISITKDSSDYLWYTLRFQHNSSDAHSVLMVYSRGHNLHAFVNGVFIGSAHGSHDNKRFTLEKPFPLKQGTNYISLLSVMSGLPDSGAYLERRVTGIRGMTIQHGHELNNFDSYLWGYKVGLSGENMQLHTNDGALKAQWSSYRNSMHQSLTWYKTMFDAPPGKDPVVLNLGSMGKGEAWVNGQSIGRYWISFLKPDGTPYQTLYHVPRSFLKPSGNLLVILEEENGFPPGISIGTVSITKVCSHVSTSHPPPVISWQAKNHTMKYGRRPKVQLHCPPRRKISSVLFSSFGTPSGDCQTYSTGSCHSPNSRAIVEKACLGKAKCSIPLSDKKFGGDPCPGVLKSLLVDVKCT